MAVLFPELEGRAHCRVDLEAESLLWRQEHPELFATSANPLLDPAVCARMVADIHRKYGVEWSYGGYLENRPHLWRGSYLEAGGTFLHLGVDLNVPQGTRVATPTEARVIVVDDDKDQDGGWGMRVFLAPTGAGVVLIYAHLQNATATPGETLEPGTVFTEVGGPPHNGNWMPHLHVQAVRAELFHEILRERFDQLDGYGPYAERDTLQTGFPDPLPYLGLSLQAL